MVVCLDVPRERKTRGISQWEPSHRTCRVPLIFPAGGSSGCRLETLVVDRRGERDRIDRSTTFEGSLYSSFPDLRTQAWCRVALERGGVGSNTEWATGVGGKMFEWENLTIPFRASFSPAMRQRRWLQICLFFPVDREPRGLLSPTTRVPSLPPSPSLLRLSRLSRIATWWLIKSPKTSAGSIESRSYHSSSRDRIPSHLRPESSLLSFRVESSGCFWIDQILEGHEEEINTRWLAGLRSPRGRNDSCDDRIYTFVEVWRSTGIVSSLSFAP